MRKILFIIMLLTGVCAFAQQSMYVWQKGIYTKVPFTSAREIPFTAGGTMMNIAGTSYYVSTIDSITFTPPVLNTTGKVIVKYNGNSATVTVPTTVKGVTYSVSGAHVVVNSTNTTTELEFVLQGVSAAGSLTYNGNYKCTFYLNGLNLTSNKGGAIDIQCGKRVALVLHDGTVNSVTDCARGVQKAALYCKGHLEIEGGGTLVLAGKTKHALSSNEYLQLKKTTGTLTVTEAVTDGLHAGQYFQMSGGIVQITGNGGDGIQAEVTSDPLDELNGQMIIKGGIIRMTIAGEDVKGLKCDNDMTISGGDIDILVTGNGSKGIGVDKDLIINEEDNPTLINVEATGGVYIDPITKGDSKCMGIKVDFNMTVEAGKITIKNTGPESKAIKVDGVYIKKGGIVEGEVETLGI